jgi:hypothetical protein
MDIVDEITGNGDSGTPGLPEFDPGGLTSLMMDENESRFDQLHEELIAPLYNAYEVRDIDTSDIISLVSEAAAGKIYAVDSSEAEFVSFLTVPLEQWKAAVDEFKRQLG